MKAIIWDHGETDSTPIGGGTTTKAQYKAAVLTILNKMRTIVDNIPVIIVPIGSSDATVVLTGWQAVRELQRELAAENA